MKGIRNGVSIFASTGYCVGTVVAMLLNAILPEDAGTEMPSAAKDETIDETNKTGDATKKYESSEDNHVEDEIEA